MTRAQVEFEKRKILEAARVAQLRRLAETTARAYRNAQTGLSDELAAMIDDSKAVDIYRPLRRAD
jgi:hypothetical protein